MMIRRSALAIPFRADIGRNGNKALVGGEESMLFRALKRQGLTGRWVAGAAVRHRIEPERQTLDYIRRYFVGQGIQSVVLGDARARQGAGRTFRGAVRIAGRWLRYIRHRVTAKPEVWLRAYADLYVQVGRESAGSFQRSRSAEITGDNR